jgi:RNA methyltransferase, TrmH family
MPRVDSLRNPRLRETQRLLESSRERRKSGLCALEGEHLIRFYIERVGAPHTLVATDDALEDRQIAALVDRVPSRDVLIVRRRVFDAMASLPADVGVLAVVRTPVPHRQKPASFALLLEDIQDPGNVGTILRTAAAAGVAQVWLSKHCAFAWSPKAMRAGQGAHFLTTIVEDVDLVAWSVAFRSKGGRVAALVARGGRSLYDADVSGRFALAVGNEGAGLSSSLREAADVEVTIPMPGAMESLNAAAAAAVALFECVRRRLQ